METARGAAGRLVSALVLAALAVVATTVASPASPIEHQIIYMAVATTLAGVSATLLVTRTDGPMRSLALGKLGAWASVTFAVSFGLASLTWTGHQSGKALLIAPESVVHALRLIVTAWALWTTGYLIGFPAPIRRGAKRLVALLVPPLKAGPAATLSPWPLFFVGLAGQALRLRTNSFGYLVDARQAVTSFSAYAQLANVLATMGLIAVVVAAVNFYSRERRGSLGALVLIAGVQAGLGLVQGMKEDVAVVAVVLLLSRGAVHGRILVRGTIVAALVFTFVVLPFVTAYRAEVRQASGATVGVLAALQRTPEIAAGQFDQQPSENSATEALSLRLRRIDSLAVVTQKTPGAIPYLPLHEVVTQPAVGLVPRILWPSKPALTSGYDFNQTYYRLPSTIISAEAVTPPADLYRRGGLPVVLGGMALLGGLYRLIDDTLSPDRDFRHLYLVAALFGPLVKHETDIASMLMGVAVAIGTTFIAARIQVIRVPRRQRAIAVAR